MEKRRDRRRTLARGSRGEAARDEGWPLMVAGTSLRAREAEERQELEAAMLAVSDREQRRFGQELHDGLCQELFSAALACDRLREKLVARSRPEAEEAARLLSKLDAAMSEARGLAHRLSPPNLAGAGLEEALRELAGATSRDFQLVCESTCEGTAGIRDEAVATHLYRIAREAVHNAARHAKPRRIDIGLVVGVKIGHLRVVDDGVGIGKGIRRRSGMGLEMMRWRAGLIGGRLDIRRTAAAETIVACHFPAAAAGMNSVVRKNRKNPIKKRKYAE